MSNPQVLLVEDDPAVSATIEAMLNEMEIYAVVHMPDGAEALKYIDECFGAVSLIICDWNMPRKNGLEFLREVRQTLPDLPFLMVTARADKDSVLAAQAARVTNYITKPFTFETLKAKIEPLLELQETV